MAYLLKSASYEVLSEWNYRDKTFVFEVNKSADYGFFPFLDPSKGSIFLETATHKETSA